ncbi:SlyX protein [Bordetella petrii]|nr:SlyX protein [Bordetella petrii]
MTAPTDTEKRLADLEIKLGLADDTLDQFNQALFRQQQQIDRLLRELAELRQQMPEGTGAGLRSLSDELPPHY